MRNPLRRPNAQPLTPDKHGNSKQAEDAHEHSKNAKRLCRTIVRDPLADEEGPGKANHCTCRGDSDEAVTSKGAICFNDIVKAHRWRLHEAESDEADSKLQTHPARRRGVLRYEAEDE